LYACWENKQREVEERFLYCESQLAVEEPKPKKRKRGQKKAPQQNPEDPFTELAAELQVEFFTKVCCDWREISLIMRDRVFEEKEEQCIDIHDVKVDVFESKIKLN